MGPVQAITTCLRKSFTWAGRAPRSEYWWFVVFSIMIGIIAIVLDHYLGLSAQRFERAGPIERITNVILLLPSLSVSVRRLHDTDLSAWYLLVPLLGCAAGIAAGAAIGTELGQIGPIIAGLIIVVFFLLQLWWFVRKGDTGPNNYGPNPLEVTQ